MLRIGHLSFDFPVVQAALSGYSDGPMRLMARRLGAPYCIHEVVLDKSVAESAKARRRLLGTLDPEDHPVGGQLMGAEAEHFSLAAAEMARHGYDVVDINFGCPVRKVLGRCRGGYLLSTPDAAIEIIQRVRAAVPPAVPVTLKMRRGMDDTPESEASFFRILDAAYEAGLAAVTVHGRTVVQKYMGRANWDFLARVKRHVGDRTLLGSGDLFTAEDIRNMLTYTGVDGVTVARGCIGNPWIFREAWALLAGRPLPDPPTVAEQGELIRDQYALYSAACGPDHAARIMRKFGIKFSEVHAHPAKVRAAFVDAWNAETFHAVLTEWYDPTRDWPPGRYKTGLGDLIAAGATSE